MFTESAISDESRQAGSRLLLQSQYIYASMHTQQPSKKTRGLKRGLPSGLGLPKWNLHSVSAPIAADERLIQDGYLKSRDPRGLMIRRGLLSRGHVEFIT